jgi:hypothetical protein
MLWQRRAVRFDQPQEPSNKPVISQKTIATVKEFASKIDDKLISGATHRLRVRKFAGLPDYEFPPVMLQELRAAGFVWLVGANFIRRFPYHAALGPDMQWHDHRVFIRQRRIRKALLYQGDIPEFALDRVEKAQNLGISNFTIHSMLPLPVKFILTDPVLIGWPAMPSIEIIRYGKPNQKLSFTIEDITGIVIAIWDANHELEI